MNWIVERGIERIPEGISFDQACWVEPLNTCLKGVMMLGLGSVDTVAILGQGPIGLIFTMLAARTGARIIASDTLAHRLALSRQLGALSADPRTPEFEQLIRSETCGRGADAVIVATSAPGLVEQALKISRPGAKVLLFAQTSATERIEVSGADICVGERVVLGSYSADVDLQADSARLVFGGGLPLEGLISHRVPLADINTGIRTAMYPSEESLKVVVHPQEAS
jgi:L-iditol 2-dehydrogenase